MEKFIEIYKEGYIAFSFYDLLNLLENAIYQKYLRQTGVSDDFLDEIISDLIYEYMQQMRYGKFMPMQEVNALNF